MTWLWNLQLHDADQSTSYKLAGRSWHFWSRQRKYLWGTVASGRASLFAWNFGRTAVPRAFLSFFCMWLEWQHLLLHFFGWNITGFLFRNPFFLRAPRNGGPIFTWFWLFFWYVCCLCSCVVVLFKLLYFCVIEYSTIFYIWYMRFGLPWQATIPFLLLAKITILNDAAMAV